MEPREELDMDAGLADRVGPTKHETETNRHELICGVCGDTLYVDDATYEKAVRALEHDPTDSPFTCPSCEVEYAEEEHGH